MSQAVPLDKTNDLFDELRRIIVSENQINEFELRRLNKQADQLAKIDASSSWVIKAGLAALAWRDEEAIRCIDNALKLDNSALTLFNLSVTCDLLNNKSRAIALAFQSYEAAKNDAKFVQGYISQLLSHGCFTEVLKTLKSSKEFGVALPDLDAKIADMINNLAQTEPRVAQERIQTEISYALSILTEERIRHHEVVITCERDFEDGLYVVTTRLLFKGTLADEMRLDSKLANLLSNDADWNPCILSTGFECRQYDYVST